MKTDTRKSKEEKELAKVFKDELQTEISKRKQAPLTWALIIIIIILFGSLGVGTYQIFLKPEKLDEAPNTNDKIENRPEIEVVEEAPVAEPQPEAVQPEPATPSSVDYTVVSGDTWSSIANANGMTSDELMKYNGTTSEDLQIGQVIKIPK